jgi:hypothetical protein
MSWSSESSSFSSECQPSSSSHIFWRRNHEVHWDEDVMVGFTWKLHLAMLSKIITSLLVEFIFGNHL